MPNLSYQVSPGKLNNLYRLFCKLLTKLTIDQDLVHIFQWLTCNCWQLLRAYRVCLESFQCYNKPLQIEVYKVQIGGFRNYLSKLLTLSILMRFQGPCLIQYGLVPC